MKKVTPNAPESSSDSDPLDPAPLSDITEPAVTARLRNPRQSDPVSHIFTIVPGVDTATLLCHACETLASLNVAKPCSDGALKPLLAESSSCRCYTRTRWLAR